MKSTRKARFQALLVFVDAPQLILLSSGNTNLIAMAVPSDTGTTFAAVTVRKIDLQNYFSEIVDLRFLFGIPKTRMRYYFELTDISKPVEMSKVNHEFPESHLPERGFFSSEHTEDFNFSSQSSDIELLALAGKWELSEFGSFHQKFADIYAFASSLRTWSNGSSEQSTKDSISEAFLGKPLRGGASYQGLFTHLNRHVPYSDRLRLSKIRKASPGKMELLGKDELFDDVKALVNHFRQGRTPIIDAYASLYSLLQSGGYLKMAVESYSKDDLNDQVILDKSKALSDLLGFDEFETVSQLCQYNSLKTAKIVLALHRRIEGAALYFAQGRVDFDDGVF